MSEALADLEWDLADRMRKALRVSGRSVQEMSEYLGVAPNTVSTWINGRNRPSPAAVRLWAMRCGVPYEWLMGEGFRKARIRWDVRYPSFGIPNESAVDRRVGLAA